MSRHAIFLPDVTEEEEKLIRVFNKAEDLKNQSDKLTDDYKALSEDINRSCMKLIEDINATIQNTQQAG